MNTREVAREALKDRIALVAFDLFKKNGYEKTTVEAISIAVGMSTRNYFRYFPTKEDVLLNAVYIFKVRFIAKFEERLRSEDIWEALKNSLIELALDCSQPQEGKVQAFIRETPALFARQLEIIEGLQNEATDLYMFQHGSYHDFNWRTINAIIRSGFSCLRAAQSEFPKEVSSDAFMDLMKEMKPAILIKP